MAASYPSSLPVKTPAGSNLSTNPHSALHDGMYDEIVAIATELGTSPKSTFASVKARLDALNPTLTSWTSSANFGGSATNVTVNYAKYYQQTALGRVYGELEITMGGASASGSFGFTLPIAVAARSAGGYVAIGRAALLDSGSNWYFGTVVATTSNTAVVHNTNVGSIDPIRQTSPFAWASGDKIHLTFDYYYV